jgi:hypothetical protein
VEIEDILDIADDISSHSWRQAWDTLYLKRGSTISNLKMAIMSVNVILAIATTALFVASFVFIPEYRGVFLPFYPVVMGLNAFYFFTKNIEIKQGGFRKIILSQKITAIASLVACLLFIPMIILSRDKAETLDLSKVFSLLSFSLPCAAFVSFIISNNEYRIQFLRNSNNTKSHKENTCPSFAKYCAFTCIFWGGMIGLYSALLFTGNEMIAWASFAIGLIGQVMIEYGFSRKEE